MSLFTRAESKKDFSQLCILISGWPKTGKTSLAAQMRANGKEPAFIATEDGHHALGVMAKRVSTWEEFKMLVNEIEKNKEAIQNVHSCFVIDLISDLDGMCQNYTAKSLAVKDLADAEWGKGFRANSREFQKEISRLFAILPITFIAHTKEKEVEIEGKDIKLQAPNLSNSSLDYINGKVDLIGFIIPSSHMSTAQAIKNPMITFRPSKLAMAGTRFPHMAREFSIDPTKLAESYSAMNSYFNNPTTSKGA